MKLSEALNVLGETVGKSKYRFVRVELTSYTEKRGGKEELRSTWQVYVEDGKIHSGSTFKEAMSELNSARKKKRVQDVEVPGVSSVEVHGVSSVEVHGVSSSAQSESSKRSKERS